MKKLFTLVAAVATSFIMTGCGLGSANNASGTGNVLGTLATGVLGNMAGNTTSSTTGSALANTGLNILSTLLGGNNVNSNSIVGTWTYQQPQVTFESSNLLGSIGGELAGNKISSTLGTQLQKIGLKSGVSSFTFDNKGNVTLSLSGRQTTGTYTLNGNTLTMKGAFGIATLTTTVSIKGNQLYMLFDANTLFNTLTKLGSSSNAISSLLGNFNGMKLGWSMSK